MSAESTATAGPSDQDGLPAVIIGVGVLQLPLLLLPAVTLSPPGSDLEIPLAVVGAVALLGLLGATLVRETTPAWTVGAYLLWTLGLGGGAYLGWLAIDTLWGAALFLVLAGALGSYGLHRYERVMLGLAGGEPE